ncbi:DeoR/GlpR family DNA-binding transcription regulator [Microbacterium sp. No. 7]|uniref:DeoR/GlpR family DNA-binding transcription regulator n=1 Tax=Microbacterium sp. No. 7 TaxID=1714373 RepID=UPI0006D236FD|nr:DeoR/GlpR family DNA-binding transcription regulator [Microbacterium sp. No. 7]ALJ20099.1 D-beta-D-heptose 1-phosphate adenosyltransferase [Microbacterium sp. No. 7]
MYAPERQQIVEQLIDAHGRVSVIDLARRFGVTTETVRRDLHQLEDRGVLRRVHGGAVAPNRVSTAEFSLAEREQRGSEAKHAIAQRALDLVPEGFTGSIYLDAGTTTGVFAHALGARVAQRSIEVVTHSMTIAHALAGVTGLGLTAIGGRVRGLTAAAVGAHTVATIERMRPDIAFVGTNGICERFGLSTPDPDEAAVKQAIVAAAQRVVVLSDSSKFGQQLLVSFAPLADIDVLVTDRAPDAALSQALIESEAEVWTP